MPRRGQVALSTVILIGGIAIIIGVGLVYLVSSFLNSSFGYQSAERALAAASSGTNDAMLRLVRNKDFQSSGYSIAVGSYSATVAVSQDNPVPGEATIVSQSVVSNYKRKVKTVVSVDQVTGEISILSSLITL
ncbi:MAG: hypothetical protein V1489_00605 [Candidatus Liptonbacteria bacterium]